MSKASDYALVLLASLETEPTQPWISVRKFALENGIPPRFLSNIVNKLVHAKILASHRGIKGGIRLARPADSVTIGEVMNAMENPMGLVDCVESPGSCPIENNCGVKQFWSVTHGLVLAALKHITLKQITSYVRPHPHSLGGRA